MNKELYPKILALNYCIYRLFRINSDIVKFIFLCKMIPRSEHPHVLHPMETKHLVLKTELHPREFNGIRLLLMNCPNLETLTIDLLPPSPIAVSFLNVKLYTLKNELYVTINKKNIYIYIYIYMDLFILLNHATMISYFSDGFIICWHRSRDILDAKYIIWVSEGDSKSRCSEELLWWFKGADIVKSFIRGCERLEKVELNTCRLIWTRVERGLHMPSLKCCNAVRTVSKFLCTILEEVIYSRLQYRVYFAI